MENTTTYSKPVSFPVERAPWLPLRASQRKLLIASVDLLLINATLLVGLQYHSGLPLSASTILLRPIWFATLTVLWLVIATATDNYNLGRTAKPFHSTFGVLKAALLTGIIYVLLPLLSPPLPVARYPLFLLIGAGAALLVVWRAVYATVFVQTHFQRRVLILGAGRAGRTAAQAIQESDSGYKTVGFVDDDTSIHGRAINDVPVLGSSGGLTDLTSTYHVADVVLAVPHAMDPDLVRSVLKCVEQGVRIVPMPELFEEVTGQIPIDHIGDHWLVTLPINRDNRGLYPVAKRSMDVVIAATALLVLAPFLPIVALLIKLESRGPVFYRPERLGRGGKPFRLWKLRTMVADADRIGDPTFTKPSDGRITRIGRFLRTAHIDELPQFINILKGEMSIVGPRPERYVPELEEAIPFYRTRYAVRPGTAGWALVKQGYADGLDDTRIKLQYDLFYIKHLSLALDINILIKTFTTILTRKGR